MNGTTYTGILRVIMLEGDTLEFFMPFRER